MHPFCVHSVGFTLDTQLDVQNGQLVLFVKLPTSQAISNSGLLQSRRFSAKIITVCGPSGW